METKVKAVQENFRRLEEKQFAPMLEKLTALEERRLKANDARMVKIEDAISLVDRHALEAGQRVIAVEERLGEVEEFLQAEFPHDPPAGPTETAQGVMVSDDEVVVVGRATSVAARIEAAGPSRTGPSATRASRSATAADVEIEIDPAAPLPLPQRKKRRPVASSTG